MTTEKFYTLCDQVEKIDVPAIDNSLPSVSDLECIEKKNIEPLLPLLTYISKDPYRGKGSTEQKAAIKKARELCLIYEPE